MQLAGATDDRFAAIESRLQRFRGSGALNVSTLWREAPSAFGIWSSDKRRLVVILDSSACSRESCWQLFEVAGPLVPCCGDNRHFPARLTRRRSTARRCCQLKEKFSVPSPRISGGKATFMARPLFRVNVFTLHACASRLCCAFRDPVQEFVVETVLIRSAVGLSGARLLLRGCVSSVIGAARFVRCQANKRRFLPLGLLAACL